MCLWSGLCESCQRAHHRAWDWVLGRDRCAQYRVQTLVLQTRHRRTFEEKPHRDLPYDWCVAQPRRLLPSSPHMTTIAAAYAAAGPGCRNLNVSAGQLVPDKKMERYLQRQGTRKRKTETDDSNVTQIT
jgi:hypothetical protein